MSERDTITSKPSNLEAIERAIAAGWRLDPHIQKWRHPKSGALYSDTPRWGRYACEDHAWMQQAQQEGK